MANLCCKAECCTYNKGDLCSKGDIVVGGKFAVDADETCCESFSEKRGDTFTSAMENPSQTIMIDCDASKCVHNSDYKCHAEYVEIKGCGANNCRETACATFKER